MEIRMGRILKFNSDKSDELIAKLKEEIGEIDHNLNHLVDYTIAWFLMLKEKYGKNFPRRTIIRSFENIEATKVVEANEKLYINREEGFIGTGMKKDEFVCNCSDIDDIIVFFKDGKYKVVKVSDKMFVGKGILYAGVFKRNDKRTIYNVVYRDGKKARITLNDSLLPVSLVIRNMTLPGEKRVRALHTSVSIPMVRLKPSE
jgi:topoisomerase-4 subunit A